MIYAVLAVLGVISIVGTLVGAKAVNQSMILSAAGSMFLSVLIAGVFALFTYLICARSLLSEKIVITKEGFTRTVPESTVG